MEGDQHTKKGGGNSNLIEDDPKWRATPNAGRPQKECNEHTNFYSGKN